MRTVLHIGMNKTGSTSLQNALYWGRAGLLSAGMLYPETGCGLSGTSMIFQYELSRMLGYSNTPAGSEGDAGKLKADLENEITAHNPNLLLLSSEYFCLRRDISRLQQFLAGHELTVVVYLRRHDYWYASLYAQAVASIPGAFPWSPGFAGYVDWLARHPDHFHSYGALLDHWRAAFPAANIVVRPLTHDLHRNEAGKSETLNMVHDFFLQISTPLPEHLAHIELRRDNRSAGPVQVQEAELNRRVQRGEAVGDFEIFPQLVEAEAVQRVILTQAADYAYIAEKYLGQTMQPLFSTAGVTV